MSQEQEQPQGQGLIEHIAELRKTLINCFIAFFIALMPSLFIAPKALDLLIDFLTKDKNIKFNFFTPTEVFLIQLKLSVVIALIVSFPYIAKKLWDFVLPALYEHEQKYVRRVAFISGLLFISGVSFCIFVLLPLLIDFAISFTSPTIEATLGISNIVNLSLWLCVAFGIMFQMPVIIKTLISSEMVSYETLSDKRPYIIVILLIVAAIMTPPDVISQLLLFIPTYLLFELGLLFSKKKSTLNSNKGD